jgi:hypothetical protein
MRSSLRSSERMTLNSRRPDRSGKPADSRAVVAGLGASLNRYRTAGRGARNLSEPYVVGERFG